MLFVYISVQILVFYMTLYKEGPQSKKVKILKFLIEHPCCHALLLTKSSGHKNTTPLELAKHIEVEIIIIIIILYCFKLWPQVLISLQQFFTQAGN